MTARRKEASESASSPSRSHAGAPDALRASSTEAPNPSAPPVGETPAGTTPALKPDLTDAASRTLRGGEFRGAIAMAIPAVLTTSSRAVMDIADYKMITYLGDSASEAALLSAQLIMWCYIVLGLGTVSLVNTYASQALGRKRHDLCAAYGWQVLYLSVMFGAVAALFIPLIRPIVVALDHDPQVLEREYAYARIAILSAAPTIAANGLGHFFNGIHRPWVTMWSAVEANVVNILVSGTLLFGWFGVEPIGIAGAAWGTTVAVTYRTLRLVLTLRSRSMDRRFHSRSNWRPSWRRMSDILRLGLPTGIQWFAEVFVWMVFVNVLVGRFGRVHQIATAIAWQYLRVSFMPAMGVGIALSALVGKSIGRGDPLRAIRETRIAAIITLSYMGACAVAFVVWPRLLLGVFTQDPEVIRIGVGLLMCAALFQFFDGMNITYASALRGAGDTLVPSVLSLSAHWAILMGGGWVVVSLWPQYGSLGPWATAAGLIVFVGLFFVWRWHRRGWMAIDLFDRTNR